MAASFIADLPPAVAALIRSGRIAEFVTTSSAGVPIDTPTLYFPSADESSLDLATGLAYPAKAERARKHPKVGMLIEGREGEPIVSIAGTAAVRDADLQANTLRYLAETGQYLPGNPDWELARQAVWYWTRIIVEVSPRRILWWPNADAMEMPPERWDAPAGRGVHISDPAPPGRVSAPSKWQQPSWGQHANDALTSSLGAHVSLFDEKEYPLPFLVRDLERTDDGFWFRLPAGLPGTPGGSTSLSFEGMYTFVGEVGACGGGFRMRVDRALPQLPTMTNGRNLWDPYPDVRREFLARLHAEVERRSQAVPHVPLLRPAPTRHYELRMERERTAPTRGN